jgi:hypothetical protein
MDGSEQEVQTDEVVMRTKWTQEPPNDLKGCGRDADEEALEDAEGDEEDVRADKLVQVRLAVCCTHLSWRFDAFTFPLVLFLARCLLSQRASSSLGVQRRQRRFRVRAATVGGCSRCSVEFSCSCVHACLHDGGKLHGLLPGLRWCLTVPVACLRRGKLLFTPGFLLFSSARGLLSVRVLSQNSAIIPSHFQHVEQESSPLFVPISTLHFEG